MELTFLEDRHLVSGQNASKIEDQRAVGLHIYMINDRSVKSFRKRRKALSLAPVWAQTISWLNLDSLKNTWAGCGACGNGVLPFLCVQTTFIQLSKLRLGNGMEFYFRPHG